MLATAAATTSSAWSRPLKLGMFGIVVAIVWVRVVPEVRSAARDFDGVRPSLVVVGVALQVAAWATYSVLTRACLGDPRAVSLGRLARIQVTTQAVGNTVPGASAVGPALTHRMLARSGVGSGDAAVALGTATFTSAIALNAVLAVALILSIPFRGVNGPYVAAALTGAATILVMGGVLVAVTRQAGWTLRTAAWIARRVRRDPVAAELAVMVAGDRLRAIAADRALLRRLASWAVVNWLLDAASLWCFLTAFGAAPGIDGLLVAFGIANVLAAVPVSPGGAGVVEWAYLTTLSSFGLPAAAVSLGVVAYRGAQALLPTVVGGACYVSLVRGPWAVTAARAGAGGGSAGGAEPAFGRPRREQSPAVLSTSSSGEAMTGEIQRGCPVNTSREIEAVERNDHELRIERRALPASAAGPHETAGGLRSRGRSGCAGANGAGLDRCGPGRTPRPDPALGGRDPGAPHR